MRAALHALGSGEARQRSTAHRYLSTAGEELRFEGEANAIIDFDDTVHRVVGILRPAASVGALEAGTAR